MTEERIVTDADGKWRETEHPSGAVERALIEPSEEFEAAREAERVAEREHVRTLAQAIVDEVRALERADLAELRAYVVAQAKRQLGYDRAQEVLDDG